MRDSDVSITSVHFQNFKALKNFTVSIRAMNILVGANNSGKSTVIGAFRVLAGGLRRARARRPEWIQGPGGRVFGYFIPSDSIPISLENVQTEYEGVNPTVSFRLSNGNRLTLYFKPPDECYLIPEVAGPAVHSTVAFNNAFPITAYVVPVLGPVEYQEDLIARETVVQGLTTHRASRHFRSYWHHFPESLNRSARGSPKHGPGWGSYHRGAKILWTPG